MVSYIYFTFICCVYLSVMKFLSVDKSLEKLYLESVVLKVG